MDHDHELKGLRCFDDYVPKHVSLGATTVRLSMGGGINVLCGMWLRNGPDRSILYQLRSFYTYAGWSGKSIV